MTDANNPCLSCGACCAYFRVSFYWAEAQMLRLPEALTEKVNDRFLCMAGTNTSAPRCAGLSGEVGKQVACTLYSQRPSACHEVNPGDERCNRARAKWGLPALPHG